MSRGHTWLWPWGVGGDSWRPCCWVVNGNLVVNRLGGTVQQGISHAVSCFVAELPGPALGTGRNGPRRLASQCCLRKGEAWESL